MTAEPHPDDLVYARIYESGRARGLAECPCEGNPGATDLLTWEDGYAEGHEEGWRVGLKAGRRHGRRQGVELALVAVALLGLAALGLGRRR